MNILKKILFLCAALVLFLAFTVKEMGCEESGDICETKICHQNMVFLAKKMDFNVDPCNDFYKFTCGQTLINSTRKPNSRVYKIRKTFYRRLLQILGAKSQPEDLNAVKSMKKFFTSCVNVEDEEPDTWIDSTWNIIDKMFDLPTKNLMLWEKSFSWPQIVGKFIRSYGIETFLNVTIVHGYERHRVLYLSVIAQDTLFSSKEFTNGTIERLITKNYAHNLEKLFANSRSRAPPTVLIPFLNVMNTTDFLNVAMFAIELIKLLDSLNENVTPNLYTIAQLQNETDALELAPEKKIDWLEFFKAIVKGTEVVMTSDMKIMINDMEVLKNILKLINKQSIKDIAVHMASSFVERYHDRIKQDFEIYKGKKKLVCLKFTLKHLSGALTYQYLKEYKNDTAIEELTKMTEAIVNEVKTHLSNTTIYDDESRNRALTILRRMRKIIGFRDFQVNATHIEKEYENLVLGDDFFDNFKSIMEWKQLNRFKLLASQNLELYWSSQRSILEVNAFNRHTENAFVLLHPYIGFPRFQLDRPLAINFGIIGKTIGHEILHSFGYTGIEYDEYGNHNSWLSQKSYKIYQERANCVIDYYSNLELEELNNTKYQHLKINGSQNLGENIADIDGLTVAYEAYRNTVKRNKDQRLPGVLSKYTPSQLFFIALSSLNCQLTSVDHFSMSVKRDQHCPNHYRILGSYFNSPYFNKVFNCPEKLHRKCTLF